MNIQTIKEGVDADDLLILIGLTALILPVTFGSGASFSSSAQPSRRRQLNFHSQKASSRNQSHSAPSASSCRGSRLAHNGFFRNIPLGK